VNNLEKKQKIRESKPTTSKEEKSETKVFFSDQVF